MKAVFVFAHPDDESMATGGTIATLTKNGHEVILITATKGEAGSRGEPPLCSKKELPLVREQELRAAAKTLGIRILHFLHFIDGTLHQLPIRKLESAILPLLKKEKPDVIFTFNKEGGSRHPDHIQVSKATTKAVAKYAQQEKKHIRLYHTAMSKVLLKKLAKDGIAYNAFGTIKGTSPSSITTTIDISQTLDTKIAAIKAHKTQHKDWERYLKRLVHEEGKTEYFELIKEYNLL